MKNTLLLISLLFSLVSFGQDTFKKYENKTGYIVYKYSGSATGYQKLSWTDYGHKEYVENSLSMSVMGFTTNENSFLLTLGSTQYKWDKGKTEGIKMVNPISKEYESYEGEYSKEMYKAVMDSLGYKHKGTEVILGKKADIYEGSMGKFWIWEGIMLKSTMNIMGMEMTVIATEIKLDATVSASKFVLPKNVKFKDVDAERNEAIENSNLDDQMKEMLRQMNGN